MSRAWPLLVLLALAACAPPASQRPSASQTAAERGYVRPPAVAASVRSPGGRVIVSGTAPAGARVRLATPGGAEAFAQADAAGAWSASLPGAAAVRLFGLSAPDVGRTLQAEGYVAITPAGQAARLAAGSGATVLAQPAAGAGLLAADFDRKGVVVLSGYGPAGAPLKVAVDGEPRGELAADADGRFMLALDKPLGPGDHAIDVAAGGGVWRRSLGVTPPAPLTGGPFRAQAVGGGWRVDWLTPGGGVQSTVIFAGGGS